MSNNTLEILYNSGTIIKVYSQILSNAKNMWDFYADIKSLTIPFATEQVNREILDARNMGVRIRFVSEVTKDNVAFCKNSVLKVGEIRHLGEIKGKIVSVKDTGKGIDPDIFPNLPPNHSKEQA